MTYPIARIGAPSIDPIIARDRQRADSAAFGSITMLRALWKSHPSIMRALHSQPPPQCAPVRRVFFADNEWSGTAQQADFVLNDRIRETVVKRDPCPRCGTRQDIGCEHRRIA